ncbi:MAG: hypothetical protein SangKO_004770 [Sandaracinaceae bacterium]
MLVALVENGDRRFAGKGHGEGAGAGMAVAVLPLYSVKRNRVPYLPQWPGISWRSIRAPPAARW